MCKYLGIVASPSQRVKVCMCNGATCHVEHDTNQMLFQTVYAAAQGQQSHSNMVI